ncbi:MAG TPA: hypothetical protein VH502_09870 [Actinoplanes sp.]
MKWMVMASLTAALAAAVPPLPSRRVDGLEFLDSRPVVIDLTSAKVGQRWRVPVIDGQHRDLTLHLSFQPAGVLATPTPTVSTRNGGIADFVIELRRRIEGSGELVVVTGGTVVRRPVSTTFRTGADVQMSTLQFSGVRLAPFTGQVRAASVEVPDAPDSVGYSDRYDPRRVGVLSSGSGNTVEVVRSGDEFSVRGATGVGRYVGTLDLVPGQPGGEVQATLRVRDLPLWPLLVLLLGLVVVQLLDRYQNRRRPVRLIHHRLARLRDRARALQRDTDLAFRICALPGEPGLLLDKRVADGLAALDDHMTAAERSGWEAHGAEYQGLVDLVDDFAALTDSFRSLAAERAALERTVAAGDREAVRDAMRRSAVGEALRGRALASATDLADAATEIHDAQRYLRAFDRLYRLLTGLREPPGVRASAEDLLRRLLAAPRDLADIDTEANELLERRWQYHVDRTAAPPGAAPVPAAVRPPADQPRPKPARQRRRWAGPVAAVLLLLLMPVLWLMLTRVEATNPSDGGPAPTPTTSRPPVVSPSPSLPEAPIAAPAVPPPASLYVPEPTAWDVVWYGVVLPVVFAAALFAVGWWAVRAWRRRRVGAPLKLGELDTASIDRELRVEGTRFAILSGLLVVLSGMSVLYAGNPTFGSAGDYLAVALWGTALGEGLHLARQLWPLPLTRQGSS